MKRLLLRLLPWLLLTVPVLAQSPGVGLDSLPGAPGQSSIPSYTGAELLFGYYAGSGGSGPTACARGWCPGAFTLSSIKTFVGSSVTGFSTDTAGINTAALQMGTGGSLNPTGSGVINANQINGAVVPTSSALVGVNSSGQLVNVSLTAPANGGTGVSNAGTATLPINFATGGSGSIQLTASGTTNASLPVGTFTVGYQGAPPCASVDDIAGQACPLTASTTLTATAVGKMISLNCGSACTITIPANSVVPFPVGVTCMLFEALAGSAVVTVAVQTDSFAEPGSGGGTGNRTMTATSTNPAAMGVCKINTTFWQATALGGVT
jgi:hypothetical protein